MNGLVSILGVVALLLLAGAIHAIAQREGVSGRWLLVAAGLVLLNDALLTSAYGLLPTDFIEGDYNWQGKLLALVATLIVTRVSAFGWSDAGLTVRQAPNSLRPAALVALAYMALFLGLAAIFPNEPASRERVAFQLTMPGLEEEAFYRGVLLLALFRAFPARKQLLGVDWSWGGVLSCALFGLAHAFGFWNGRFHWDPVVMLLTGGPSLIAVWLVLRTRSLLLPIVLHNFGNAIMLLI